MVRQTLTAQYFVKPSIPLCIKPFTLLCKALYTPTKSFRLCKDHYTHVAEMVLRVPVITITSTMMAVAFFILTFTHF